MNKSLWLAASLAALLVLGCARQKEPAEQVVANVEAAFGAAHDVAAKYAPDGLQSVDAQVDLSQGEPRKGRLQRGACERTGCQHRRGQL